ncbi:hypothetical protein F4859DRAFT_498042 [Xylaria cf. heliscus]|nr:hypothetical protein F4859DRAFT_498042 [Xylaria cf. heliscus]
MFISLRAKALLGYMIPQYKGSRGPDSGGPDTTATTSDFPECSIPYVQREPERREREHGREREREPQDAPDVGTSTRTSTRTSTGTVHAKGKGIDVPADEPEQGTTQGTTCARRIGSVQFVEDAPPGRSRNAKGKAPAARENGHHAEHRQDVRQRHRSPYPTREPKTRQKATAGPVPVSVSVTAPIPIPTSTAISNRRGDQRDPTRLEYYTNATSWVEDTDNDNENDIDDDDDDDDDDYEDVIMERNPLAHYPPIGKSLDQKRQIRAGGPQTSLLTSGLQRYARLCEDDVGFAERIRAAAERQGGSSRKQKKLLQQLRQQGTKTRIPACRKPDAPDWGFDMADPGYDGTTIFGETVTPVYRGGPNTPGYRRAGIS